MTSTLTKILYVVDDPDIAEVTLMTLEHFGRFDIRHCASGFEALSVYPGFSLQPVLMDVMMPGMDGLETIQRLRETFGAHLAPVIFVTAKAQVREQFKYTEPGALGVIVKPFDPLKLCDQIKGLWDTAHGT